MSEVLEKAKLAKEASLQLAVLDSSVKKEVLLDIADLLDEKRGEIFIQNKKDMALAENLSESLVKRLKLNDKKMDSIINGLKDLVTIEEPVGKTLETLELQDGLILYKVSCPLGVVGAVFESRPDAFVQIFSLCFRSGNACILKGGKEATHTNKILYEIITSVTDKVVKNAVIFLESREEVNEMLKLDEYIDLIIPRGSNKLVSFVKENTKIPILGHSDGICHAYVDNEVDFAIAEKVCYDAKVQYPAVCNAIETLLVHRNVAEKFLPIICKSYIRAGVELRGDEKAREFFEMKEASESDWDTEYNALIISIKVVSNLNEAIKHINSHGSKHSEVILTTNKETAKKFMSGVDASSVMWNASTRFADGYRYGKGAETGISTGKIHARGPVGMEGLLIYKYFLVGDGNTVGEDLPYTHKKLDLTLSLGNNNS